MAMKPLTSGGTNPSSRRVVVQPVYEDFKPMSEWKQDQESDTLLIYLPGFMKENLKVSTEGKNTIRVRGERLVAGNKWHRLLEDYQVPDYCNLKGTRARFEGGIVTITVPKKTMPPIGPKDETKPTQEQIETKSQKGQDYIPSKSTPNEKDEAKSIQESPLPPQKTQPSLPHETTPGVDSQTKPTSSRTPSMHPMPQKMSQDDNAPKPTSTNIGDKGKDKDSSEALASQKMLDEPKTPKGQEEEQRDKTRDSSEGKGKPEKTEISENAMQNNERMNAEKSKESVLLDQVGNDTKKIAEKSKLEKDGAGFPHADKNEYVEPKANQTTNATASGTSSHFRLEKYKQSLKGLKELDVERQLMVNVGVGVAVLVIVALGTYAFYRARK